MSIDTETVFQVFHIEDDSGDWRGIPQFMRGSIRQRIFEVDEGAWIKNVESSGDFDSVFKYQIRWVVNGSPARLDYWFVADPDVKPIEAEINTDATFIFDAMGPDKYGRMVSRLPQGLRSVAKHVDNSLSQIRIFTAYPEVEQSIKNLKPPKTIQMPIPVIFKSNPSALYNYLLTRLGF